VTTTKGSSIAVIIADASRVHCQPMATALWRSRYRFDVFCSANESEDALRALKGKHPEVVAIASNLHERPLAGFKVLRKL
jgi:DNA-binding NarL/FixJ family response regulator